MKLSKIKPEDIGTLCHLLKLPKSIVVFDPFGVIDKVNIPIIYDITQLLQQAKQYKTCINLSNQTLEVLSFEYILEPDRHQRNYKSFTGHHFLGFNNPDGTLRWFQPASASDPHFLHLYNGSGWKAKLIKTIAKWAFKAGLQKSISPNHFCLYSKESNYLKEKFGNKEFAIFTGTIGRNRKAVAAVCQGNEAKQYIKIPISQNTRKLVNKEYDHLNTLGRFQFDTLDIPKATWNEHNLLLNNVQPRNPIEVAHITTLHLKAVIEIFSNTQQRKLLTQTATYQNVQKRIHALRTLKGIDLPLEKQTKLYENLELLYRAKDREELVSVGYAHGDFTPWNMFVSKDKIHVYDWELAMPEQLPLYDLLHYTFQSSILIHHQSFPKIKDKIEHLRKLPEVKHILAESQMDFWTCYRWYLLDNCSYYLDLYCRQEHLHPQAIWLIDCWIQATWDAVRTPCVKNNAYLVFK
jgi:hypothetical protein